MTFRALAGERCSSVPPTGCSIPTTTAAPCLLSIVDATERRQLEARRIALGELRHRMKNLLGLVQAIGARPRPRIERARNTATHSSVGSMRSLQAHNAAYSQEGEADLHEVLQRTLRPYSEGSLGVLVEAGAERIAASKQIMPLRPDCSRARDNGDLWRAFNTLWTGSRPLGG